MSEGGWIGGVPLTPQQRIVVPGDAKRAAIALERIADVLEGKPQMEVEYRIAIYDLKIPDYPATLWTTDDLERAKEFYDREVPRREGQPRIEVRLERRYVRAWETHDGLDDLGPE